MVVKTNVHIENALIDLLARHGSIPDDYVKKIATKYKMQYLVAGDTLVELLYKHHTFNEAIQIINFNYQIK